MVSALDSGLGCPGKSAAWGHYVVFLVKTLLSPCISSPRSIVGSIPANCYGNLTTCWEVICDGLASFPGRIAVFLDASWYGNRGDQLWRCGPVWPDRVQMCVVRILSANGARGEVRVIQGEKYYFEHLPSKCIGTDTSRRVAPVFVASC